MALRKQIFSIQYLRGIAALMVALGHTYGSLDPSATLLPDWLYKYFFFRGAIGVGIFFVISGFVMAHTALLGENGIENPATFFTKRLIRVVPLYWLANAAVMFLLYRDDLRRVLICMFFLSTDYAGHAPEFGTALLYVGWTLNYEMYFYTVFALSLLFRRFAFLTLVAYFLLTLVGLPVLAKGYLLLEPTQSYGFSNYYLAISTNPIIWNFIFGIFCAFAYHWLIPHVNSSQMKPIAKAVAILSLICAVLTPSLSSLFFVGLPAAALLLAWSLLESTSLSFQNRKWIYLGEISYALYLVHPIVLDLMKPIAKPVAEGQYHIFIAGYLILGTLCIWAAHITHQYVERPIMAIGKKVVQRLESNFQLASNQLKQ